jgi:hypothetical protein
MYHASADDRGTVQALSRELDVARQDGMFAQYLMSASIDPCNRGYTIQAQHQSRKITIIVKHVIHPFVTPPIAATQHYTTFSYCTCAITTKSTTIP